MSMEKISYQELDKALITVATVINASIVLPRPANDAREVSNTTSECKLPFLKKKPTMKINAVSDLLAK